MSTTVLSGNESLKEYLGNDVIYKLGSSKLCYTEGVRTIAIDYESYWFLDVINSYQSNLKDEDFQVWKIEREYSFVMIENIKVVVQRKDKFKVTCDDGNGTVLLTQIIPFSDFYFDEYTVWLANNIIYLPSEH